MNCTTQVCDNVLLIVCGNVCLNLNVHYPLPLICIVIIDHRFSKCSAGYICAQNLYVRNSKLEFLPINSNNSLHLSYCFYIVFQIYVISDI